MASLDPVNGQNGLEDDSNIRDTEPLLGGPGDATMKPDAPMIRNLYLGTGWIAQGGAALLVALIWAGVFLNPLLPLVSPHPLLQSAGVFVLTQAILILQPAWVPGATKTAAARAHALLQLLAIVLFASGIAVIETNKTRSHNPHFHSAHAYLGVATGAILFVQAFFGLLLWAVPARVFGSIDRAKSFYRWHRWSGYLLLVLVLATVAAATQTDYNKNVLDIKLWSVLVAAALVLVGVLPRVSLQKLGFRRPA